MQTIFDMTSNTFASDCRAGFVLPDDQAERLSQLDRILEIVGEMDTRHDCAPLRDGSYERWKSLLIECGLRR